MGKQRFTNSDKIGWGAAAKDAGYVSRSTRSQNRAAMAILKREAKKLGLTVPPSAAKLAPARADQGGLRGVQDRPEEAATDADARALAEKLIARVRNTF